MSYPFLVAGGVEGGEPASFVTITPRAVVLVGCVLTRLRGLADASVHCIATSPPYLDARDYKVPPTAWPEVTYRPRFDLPEVTVPAMTCCLGHEATLLAYVGHLVLVARELHRVLRTDGVFWLNLGAGYSSGTTAPRKPTTTQGPHVPASWKGRCHGPRVTGGLPAKQLIRAPSAVCDALQAEGWFVRNEVVWYKRNAKPDSATDRCSPAHESLFLLTRSPRYFFDAHAISTPSKGPSRNRARKFGDDRGDPGDHHGAGVPWSGDLALPRDVWDVPVGRFKGGHFATFPPELVEKCVRAGASEVGCCPSCGAPWRRLLTKSDPISTRGGRRKHADLYRRQGATGALATGKYFARVHVGWERTCACAHARPSPCVVLDPFAGSGTTLGVADALGHIGVGVDAQPDYVEELMPTRIAEVVARLRRGAVARPRKSRQQAAALNANSGTRAPTADQLHLFEAAPAKETVDA